jgi:voltage-gated potassium channel
MLSANDQKPASGWRRTCYEVIFEANTPSGRAFDLGLITCISLSIAIVLMESVKGIQNTYGEGLQFVGTVITGVFTFEYILRLICVNQPLTYALSFFGLIDLGAILPGYFSLIFPGTHYFSVIRVFRLLRVFRILRLASFLREADHLMNAMSASRRKIMVFLFAILNLVIVIGSLMYVVEGEENGFTSIPVSIYWAVVTLTTVGYGDISPKTSLGQTIATLVMVLGYSIIAVPTGIVTAEMTRTNSGQAPTPDCPECGQSGHDHDARFCKHCGAMLKGDKA